MPFRVHTLIIPRFVHNPRDLLASRDCIVLAIIFVVVIINVALYWFYNLNFYYPCEC